MSVDVSQTGDDFPQFSFTLQDSQAQDTRVSPPEGHSRGTVPLQNQAANRQQIGLIQTWLVLEISSHV